MAGFGSETATARLARLLTMVPWLVNRQGIDLHEAADDLGVSVEQLEADLNLLFLCGYGQMPDELIEADWEEGRVFVGNADTIARPLRLGVDEAVTLVVGLRALREVPGLGDRDAVERALAKLEDAAGAAAAPARRVLAEVADGASPELLALAQRAIADHRRVHLRYLVPARDESTERDVDRGAARVFRLSRIVGGVRTAGRPASFEVPDDHEPEMMVQRVASPPTQPSPAVLRVRRGTGHSLRRLARTVGEVDDTWDLVDLDYADLEDYAEELAGYGADVVVEAPSELVGSVVRRLRGALAAHGGAD